MEASVWLALVNGLASNPAMLLLCVVLLGVGWLTYKFGGKVLDSIVQRVDKLDLRLQGIERSLQEIVIIKKDVDQLDDRLDRAEAKIDILIDRKNKQ